MGWEIIAEGKPLAMPGPFHTIEQVKSANEQAGFDFFWPLAMRFFRCRVEPGLIGGRIFITVEA